MRIFLMGGTKESIEIIKELKIKDSKGHYITVTTTTEFGGDIAKEAGADEVIFKDIDRNEKIKLLKENEYDVLIDATHPFAVNASKSACIISQKANIKYIRYERKSFKVPNSEKVHNVYSFDEAGQLIANKFKDKKILYLSGVSTIETILKYTERENLYVRVLPVLSSIEKCEGLKIPSKNIIAMQGTFSCEFNMSLMKELCSEIVVTKESGEIGGAPSKIKAAQQLGLDLIVVNREEVNELSGKTIVNDMYSLKKELKSIEKE